MVHVPYMEHMGWQSSWKIQKWFHAFRAKKNMALLSRWGVALSQSWKAKIHNRAQTIKVKRLIIWLVLGQGCTQDRVPVLELLHLNSIFHQIVQHIGTCFLLWCSHKTIEQISYPTGYGAFLGLRQFFQSSKVQGTILMEACATRPGLAHSWFQVTGCDNGFVDDHP